MEMVYQKIVALADEGVWVPAVSNGGLHQLLAELEVRGWKIVPPPAVDEKMAGDLLAVLVAEAGIPQFGAGQELTQSFWTVWQEAKNFLEKGGEKK